MKTQKYLLFCWLTLLLPLASASPDSDLLAASNRGNIHAIETALSKGANPNQPDDKGVVPLMWAAYQGNLAAVNTLLKAGANVNLACANLNLLPEEPIKYRDTPLGLAVSQGHLPVVQALIAKGANINVENNLRRPALLLAVQTGNTAMVRVLLDAGANLNAKGGLDENTPLIEAVKTGNQTIMDMLVKAGAEVNTINKNGESPLSLTKQNDSTNMMAVIKAKGAKEPQALYIKIPLALLLFFIPFVFTINVIPAILPGDTNSLSTSISAFIIASSLSALFSAIAWQMPTSTFDAIKNEMFDGFIGVIAAFISLLFFIIGVHLFFKHITALFFTSQR